MPARRLRSDTDCSWARTYQRERRGWPATREVGQSGRPATGSNEPPVGGAFVEDEVRTAVMTMVFEASDPDGLLTVLAKYVVMARGEPGCRNIDLCNSFSRPNRLVVISKWDSEESAREHVGSPTMVEMAEACTGLLAGPPDIDLLEGLSAHDLN